MVFRFGAIDRISLRVADASQDFLAVIELVHHALLESSLGGVGRRWTKSLGHDLAEGPVRQFGFLVDVCYDKA